MNIVIADPHSLCREAIVNFIRHADQDLEVSGAGDYAGMMDILGGQKTDILLFDPHLPGLPMIDDYSDIGAAYPDIRMGLIVGDATDMKDLPEGQMQGMFPRTLSTKAFLQGIYQVLAGEKFIPDQKAMIALVSGLDNTPRKSPDFYHLTAREKEVIGFLAKGATNKDIARALDLQIVTVKLHVRGICRKLDAKNRTQAALIAIENGWDM